MQTITTQRVQTTDRNTNQLQDNINSSLTSLGNEINKLTVIGAAMLSPITLDQFQRQAGPGWVLCNGASCVGTSYNKLTGFLTVPTEADIGVFHWFIRIN
jgi:hypothetical protein